MEVKRILTEDGSDTLYVPGLDETYHSTHGAIQESTHVFIKNGLEYYQGEHHASKLRILEFGFGTGLNALLTLLNSQGTAISYHSLEKYPVDLSSASQLNYGALLADPDAFKEIISSSWNKWVPISDNFRLFKQEIDFLDFEPEETFDIIYFDAFAPSKQPELWSIDILEKCYRALAPQGIFVTYSAKGQLRRDLQELGFKVERLPGPPGKFEMLRATKT